MFPPASDPTSTLAKTDPVKGESSGIRAPGDQLLRADRLAELWTARQNDLRAQIAGVTVSPRCFRPVSIRFATLGFNKIANRDRQLQELKRLSPVNLVGRSAAPTLLFPWNKDENVPLEQAEKMHAALTKAGVLAELVVKRGEGHGWSDNPEDSAKIVDWLNRRVKKE